MENPYEGPAVGGQEENTENRVFISHNVLQDRVLRVKVKS